ncbi:toll-Interleukin receptor [Pseudoalteromonas sp. SCSIO_11900]|uniref:toll/interleukin-1 receptor domain-containing protein n=1 Tax=Pseudoalteromonas sp. SCSIO_11900 TaxID=1461766 RepID=UPI0004534FC5|nr:toll/interleukin-1 receptor domain-containing protein [Pseudoalteromonas sp. SCSIO_11900]EWS96429.1 toll-Interleukin receptor [Pseudoalteromonas sp. SCSIO_11900]
MNKKIFISYAHKDELYKEELIEHMSGLRRAGIINEWNDRKIVAGQNWEEEISSSLTSSNIILFLISASFMNSDYCMGVEVKTALEMHERREAQLIPIVIRAVDWSDSEISKIQGLPKDARPISSWENADEAWLDVISGLKNHIQNFEPKTPAVTSIVNSTEINCTKFINDWLVDTEIVLTHRKVNQVSLKDIYVIPDIELESKDDLVDIKSSKYLFEEKGSYIISGEEQQGKTSLLKYLYRELLKEQYLPLYIDAKTIKKASIESEITKQLNLQYEDLTYLAFTSSRKVIILLDNIDEIGLNQKYKNKFLADINLLTQKVYITCHSSYNYIYGDLPALDDYESIELLGLGNKKREELVQKWISLGVEENIDEKELYTKCDELKLRLNGIIKKNIVPPKPIYILMLLQMFEANAQLNLELTSYGHCYQQLIYQSFDKAHISKQDFDKYLNVLTELAWEIFKKENNLNPFEVELFFTNYCKSFLSIDKEKVLNKLISHSILNDNGINLGFKYPYIYYFFVGKKIAESYRDSDETKTKIEGLLSKLHREDYANILIFITHHTKDSWVLHEIKSVLDSLFEEHNEATLSKTQLSFMSDFMKAIPELIIEQREIQKERDDQNDQLDELERKNESEEGESLDILAKINQTFKGMEVAGQIIRNRHATLTRQSMEDLAKTGAFAGLRFLEYFIKISDTAKKEIIKLISTHLLEHPNISNKEIEKQAENAYLHLTYGIINGVTRKIASSIGSKEALEVYREMEYKVGTPAFNLIRQAIDLQFTKTVNIDHISACIKELQDNQVCLRILKEMVIQHIYMFPVEYKEKQQLSHLLGISIQGQRLMDSRKIGKA